MSEEIIVADHAAEGGKARAESLSSEERSEIAREAALARWQKAGKNEIVRATHGSPDRPLRIGSVAIPCYVLENGMRVLSGRGMQTALELGQSHGSKLKALLRRKSVKPYVSNELAMALERPVRFIRPGRGGKLAVGYEATILPDICDAVLQARKSEKLTFQESLVADQCEILTRAFAKVGIIALIDEATGYQDSRAKDALAKILEAFIAKELRKWVSTFPVDYYKELFRLRGWKFPNLPADQRKRPVLVGKLTNDVVYDRLAPGVREELHRLTPRDDKGRLKHKLFQRLTDDVGSPKLREHLASVVALMKASDRWSQFVGMLNRALPRYNDTAFLPFEDV